METMDAELRIAYRLRRVRTAMIGHMRLPFQPKRDETTPGAVNIGPQASTKVIKVPTKKS